MARITSDDVRDGLEIRGRRILHQGTIIGHVVNRASKSGRMLGSFVARPEFVGRINAFDLSIEEVASTRELLLTRVSRRLVAPIREGRFGGFPAQEAVEVTEPANPIEFGSVPR